MRIRSASIAIALALAMVVTASAATLTPVSGTIENYPELGIFDRAGVQDAVQSFYFRTTALNRHFRRGIAEFAIPIAVIAGTLTLRETGGTTGIPQPPVTHLLYAYPSADLAITTADYDRAAFLVGSFETDPNFRTSFAFDVTTLVRAASGGTLGFRVQLAVDPTYTDFNAFGSQFAVALDLLTVGDRLNEMITNIDALAAGGALDRGTANALDATLSAAVASLGADNGAAARAQIEAFSQLVEALARAGRLTSEQAESFVDSVDALLEFVP